MRRFPVWQSWRSFETVEKLRFSDNLYSDCAEHESSESMKTSAILAGFLAALHRYMPSVFMHLRRKNGRYRQTERRNCGCSFSFFMLVRV